MRRAVRRAAAALLLPALAAAGCAASSAREALRRDLAAVRAGRSEPAPSPFGVDRPGIVHCHTRLSHDSPGPLEEVVAAARRTGTAWIALTDHSNPRITSEQPRCLVDGVLLVPGQEISAWSSSVHSVGASRNVEKAAPRGKKWFSEYAEEIRSLGGVPVYGHMNHFGYVPRMVVDGIACYDLSEDYRDVAIRRFLPVLGCLSSGDPEASGEAYLLFVQTRQDYHRRVWDDYLAEGPCAGLAETNAHGKFRWFGRVWDPYAGLFGLVRNHALVPALDEASLLEALRRGRVAIGFDAAADAAGARFEAFRGQRPAAAMGDAVALDPALSLAVHLPLPAGVRILRDGRPWREGTGRVLQFPVDGPGVYRAEADLAAGGAGRPWVWFNPVRVTAPAGGAR